MLSWLEDCIIYHVDGSLSVDDFKELKFSQFEEIFATEINNNLLEISYTWIDPVKIRDKFVSKDQKNVCCWYFKSEKTLCIFSNLESSVAHVINKLSNITLSNYGRINTFDFWKKYYLKENNWFAKLIAIHVKKTPTAFDNREIRKISLNELLPSGHFHYFTNNLVTTLNFIHGETAFYVDSASVISFPNTIKETNILFVMEKIIEELRQKKL